jgi:hypothetical protein
MRRALVKSVEIQTETLPPSPTRPLGTKLARRPEESYRSDSFPARGAEVVIASRTIPSTESGPVRRDQIADRVVLGSPPCFAGLGELIGDVVAG